MSDELDAIKEVINDPEHIRNIAIAAHIDHGKCVSPDQRIALSGGKQVKAEELFEEFSDKGEIVSKGEETQIKVDSGDVRVKSLDKRTGEVVDGEVTDLWKMENKDSIYRVELEDGKKVETTPEHEFLTLRQNGSFDFVEARNLSENHTVVGSRLLEADSLSESELKVEILERLSEDANYYIRLEEEFAEKLQSDMKELGMEKTYEQIRPVLEFESFRHCSWRGEYRLKTVLQLAEKFSSKAELYDSIETVNRRGTDSKGVQSSIEVELPDDLSGLFYLAGMFFGDGDLEGNITNDNEEIQKIVGRKAADLGLEPIAREFEERATRIEIGGKTLRRILEDLFDYPEEDKSASIKISDLVFRSPERYISEFIRGYMDADGTVEDSRSAVSVGSKSLKMLEDLQLLLQRFDIASKLNRENKTLYISGSLSLENYLEIGFEHPVKQQKLEELVKEAESSKADRVPIDGEEVREVRKKAELTQSDMITSYTNYENNHVGLTKKSLRKITERFEEEGFEGQKLRRLERLAVADTTFSKVKNIEKMENTETVYDFTVEDHHNFISEGIVVHNTTLTDNLLARAGMISDKLAGDQRFMDFDDQEAERGITIYSANISMVHEFDGDDYLINLIDTPGHVDFGGDVTRAMRAVDGVVVLVDAVDGVMPQTETVMKQALQEGVKPVLFINKVDRLIEEMQLTPEEMQERFKKIIREVNTALRKYADDETAENWKMKVDDGTVAFGSALMNWAISVPFMKETGISFGEIIERVNEDDHEGLAEDAPIEEVVLDMVVKHLIDPHTSAEWRIPAVWPGDVDSEVGKDMMQHDQDGRLVGVVTNVEDDEHAGTIATARLFSGTVNEGDELYGIGSQKTERAQQVGIYSGPRKLTVDSVPCGNIAAITGPDFSTGETFILDGEEEIQPFEQIEHVFEPVVTKSIEPKRTSDLPKLIEALRKRSKEDNTIEVDIDEETGETLVSGLGELHIEAKVERHLEEKGIDIEVSEPIVVFREGIDDSSPEMMGKSPNRHNKLEISVEPLDESVRKFLKEDLQEVKMEADEDREITDAMIEAGLDKEDAENVMDVFEENLFINASRGIKNLREIKEYLVDAFHEFCEEGPLAGEPVIGLKVKLHDAQLHEDAIHRGPAQMIPATKDAMKRGFLEATPRLIEPKQVLRIDTPSDTMGDAMTEVSNRRGDVINMEEEGDSSVIKCKLPVEELFGFEADLKGATNGKGFFSLIDLIFEPLPRNLQEEKIMDIRERKGMKQEMPSVEE
ncbi:MAG: elongation factor EF-2 [Candidatus Nanohaloarchaea archaeon]